MYHISYKQGLVENCHIGIPNCHTRIAICDVKLSMYHVSYLHCIAKQGLRIAICQFPKSDCKQDNPDNYYKALLKKTTTKPFSF